jgi:hypothetical protein
MSSDCLVLKICSISVDSVITVYVIYDVNTEYFSVCGKKECGVDFNFISYSVTAIETLISFIFSNKQNITYSIYNHNDLPFNQEEITYDYLVESLIENIYEISYKTEHNNYSKRRVTKMLKMLKSVCNYY